MKKVTSKDGTSIAYDQSGNGPILILVDGALCSRNFGPMPKLAELLTGHFTVINYDRRGRNDSGDTQPYAPEREIEDLAAIIKATGESVYVAGISSGAALALAATASGLNIKKLALYEAPFDVDNTGHKAPKDSLQKLQKMIAEDRRGDAVKFFLHDMIGVPSFAVFMMKLMPVFKKLKASAHTLPYDIELLGDLSLPEKEAVSIKVPTLVGYGEKSPGSMQNAMKKLSDTIPGAELQMFKGQTHNISGKALAPALIEFFGE
ncbi:MAG TPA: alpha/beta hydrolase [Mucilaginibacter sp.]|nr:alpha/beta hydrolase [Mucilaginibacter sp.]